MAYSFNPFTGNFDYYEPSATGGGTGDVVGPASATDNAIARYDLTTGKLIQNSNASIDDTGNLTANNFSGTHSGTSTGTNSGDQTITLTSDVTGSGTGSFATTIANNAVSLAKMADVATGTVFYRKTAGTGDPEVQTLATLKTDLALTGTNSGDVTLAGTPDYITISGQTITRNKLDLVDDLNTFTSANLATMLTDETGSGANVFAVSPNLTGTPSVQPTATSTNTNYSVVSAGAVTNLCVNPKFEVNVTDGWSDYGVVTRSRTTGQKKWGSASMQLTTSSANAGATLNAVACDTSSTYIFSFWAKGAVGGEDMQIEMDGNVGAATNTNEVFTFGIGNPITTNWQRYRWYYTTTTDTTLTCRIYTSVATAQTIYIDGVQLEKKALVSPFTDYSPTPYCDGSLGNGHSWSGTADNSTSSRVAGTHYLAPIGANSVGSLVQLQNGTLDGKMHFNSDWGFKAVPFSATPLFPYIFSGSAETEVALSGIPEGILLAENRGNGAAAYVKSAATTKEGFVLDFASLTSGAGMIVYSPADMTAMQAAGGVFFKFAGKAQNSDMYKWGVDYVQAGDLSFRFNKRHTILGGGGMTATDTAAYAGTVTSAAASPTITGVGTAFLTDYKRGDYFQWQWDGTQWGIGTVASVASNTSLTLTANAGQTTVVGRAHKSKTRQYSPAVLQLEGTYANHTSTVGDFIYSIYPSGGNGQLRVLKSSAIASTTIPSADNVGFSLMAGRASRTSAVPITASAAETTVIDGYTVPAYELQAGNTLKIKFFGTSDTLASTSTITWRVKLGGTTILTSTARQVGSANLMHFEGEITIVGTSTTAQKASMHVTGQDTTTVTAGGIYDLINNGSSSVDCRIDNALTVTAQYSDASTMSMSYASIYLEQ